MAFESGRKLFRFFGVAHSWKAKGLHMTNRTASVLGMIFWGFFFTFLTTARLYPPPPLSIHNMPLLFVPLGAFILAMPNVPLRWFGYYAGLCAVPMLLLTSDNIGATLRLWGWDNDFRAYLLPAFLFVATIYGSIAAAWLRQWLHRIFAGLAARIRMPKS